MKKMIRKIRMAAWLLIVCVAGFWNDLHAQATVDIRIDSLELLVGQQTQLTLDVLNICFFIFSFF